MCNAATPAENKVKFKGTHNLRTCLQISDACFAAGLEFQELQHMATHISSHKNLLQNLRTID
jgi:hypothetical protein